MQILTYIGRRLIFVGPQLIGILLVTFLLLKLIPGDPAVMMLGPFATGSRFEMQLPDGGPLLQSELADVQPGRYFTDVTAFHGVVVRVTHAIAPQSEGGVRVTYRTEVEGPGAAEIGAGVSADFPDVLAALKRLAEAGAPAR